MQSVYRIPVGQRLSIPANPRSESEVEFAPILRTEASVFARTLGSIPDGREIADGCVEQFIPERDIQVIAPNSDEDEVEPTPEPEEEGSADETEELVESGSETEAVETLESVTTEDEATPEPEDEG